MSLFAIFSTYKVYIIIALILVFCMYLIYSYTNKYRIKVNFNRFTYDSDTIKLNTDTIDVCSSQAKLKQASLGKVNMDKSKNLKKKLESTESSVINTIKSNVSSAVNTIKERTPGILNTIKSETSSAVDTIRSRAPSVISAIKSEASSLARTVSSAVTDATSSPGPVLSPPSSVRN